jgi:hypothetical protein
MEQGRVILQELTMLAASGSGWNVPETDIHAYLVSAALSGSLSRYQLSTGPQREGLRRGPTDPNSPGCSRVSTPATSSSSPDLIGSLVPIATCSTPSTSSLTCRFSAHIATRNVKQASAMPGPFGYGGSRYFLCCSLWPRPPTGHAMLCND